MVWFVTVMSAPIWKLIAYFALWISTVPSEGVMAAVDLRLQPAEPNDWQANAPMLEVSGKHHRATGAFMRNVRTNSQSIEQSTVFRSGGTDWRSVPVKHTHRPHPYSKAMWCCKLRTCWPQRLSAVTFAVFSKRRCKSVSHWNKGNSLKNPPGVMRRYPSGGIEKKYDWSIFPCTKRCHRNYPERHHWGPLQFCR